MKILLASLLIASFTLPVVAHHSFGAEYDADKPVTISGVVTKMEWTNPHIHLFLDVMTGGKVVNWKFEGYPPSVLYRTGWSREGTLKVGDKLTISGWQARDGTAWAQGREVTFADGKKLFLGPPAGTGEGGATPAVDRPSAK